MARYRWPVLVLLAVLGAALLWSILRNPASDSTIESEAEVEQEHGRATEPEDEAQVSGRVLRGESTGGVAAAKVFARCGDVTMNVAANRKGRFSFAELPDGACRLEAKAPGYTGSGPQGAASIEVRVRKEQSLSRVEITLYETASVSGRVLADGRGIGGAVLSLLYVEAPGETEAFVVDRGIVSDDEGRFFLHDLGPGRVQVLAEHSDYALAESDELFVHSGSRMRDVIVELAGGGRVSGAVVDEDGRPVRGAQVRLVAPGSRGVRSRRSSANGTFDFDAISPGLASVFVRAKGYREQRLREVEVLAGEEIQLEVVLTKVDGFGGVVLQPDGRPARNAGVFVTSAGKTPPAFRRARRPKAYTDDDGRFWIEGWEEHWRSCYAKHARLGASDEVPIPDPGGHVELRLKGGGSLTGNVVDDGGTPISRFDVYVAGFLAEADGQAGLGGMPRKSVRDASGRFSFQALAPGTYELRVTAPGFPAAMSKGHEVQVGMDTDTGPIVLESGGVVIGTVVDEETGEPVGRARVSSSDAARYQSRVGRTSTSGEGEFRLDGVRAERLSVTVRASGYVTRIVSAVEVEADGVTDLGLVALSPLGEDAGRGAMQYGGIGAVLQLDGDRIFVRSAFDGSPSAESGLDEGTEILRINGYDVSDLGLRRAVELIRGEDGTSVSLEVVRADKGYVETIDVERAEVRTKGRRRTR